MNWERADPGPVNPLSWSVPVLRVAGIRFRLHFTIALYALVVLLRSGFGPETGETALGLRVAAPALGALLALGFVRELVRALVVRAAGGTADEVVLWPLGSLQGIDPAPGWRAAMVAGVAGLATSAFLLAAGGLALGFLTGDWGDAVLANPLSAAWLRNPHPWWIDILWISHWTNLQLTLLVLLPMLPLDGGRIASALILRARGAYEMPRLAATTTLIVAGLVGIVAIVRDLGTLLTVCIACAGYAAFDLWRLRAGDMVAADQGPWVVHARQVRQMADAERERKAAAARQAAEQAAQDAVRASAEAAEHELDRILEKIAREGKESLTRKERSALEDATERRRKRGIDEGPRG